MPEGQTHTHTHIEERGKKQDKHSHCDIDRDNNDSETDCDTERVTNRDSFRDLSQILLSCHMALIGRQRAMQNQPQATQPYDMIQ